MQGRVTLSATEAELAATTPCAQDMLLVMHVMELIGRKVSKSMILEIDSKGAKYLTHNWSVGGQTSRPVNVREWFLRDLKEEGIIEVKCRLLETTTVQIWSLRTCRDRCLTRSTSRHTAVTKST